jgi:hypothetical protein
MHTNNISYTCRISRGPAHRQKATIGNTTPANKA